jgi:hypothetical protein
MRKLIVAEFISLDGVIQAPGNPEEDTDGGFTQGGWTHPYWHDEIGAHFFEAFSRADALLLGRKTWQGHGAAFEPMPAGDPFGDAMNGIRKYVVVRIYLWMAVAYFIAPWQKMILWMNMPCMCILSCWEVASDCFPEESESI